MSPLTANSVWLASCLPEYARFRRALGAVEQEQERLLLETLRRNEQTELGRRHGFAKIRSYENYARRVPVRDYEAFRPQIERLASGGTHVLTEEPTKLFEPTSGSAGAAKLIPYTRSLEREFQRGIQAWIADLFLQRPYLMAGCAYWAVSPMAEAEATTPGGIPIGFQEDSEYVGGWRKPLVDAAMAVPSNVRTIRSFDDYWYAVLDHLVRRRDLRLISVWNPSFLTLLTQRLSGYADRLARDHPSLREALRAPAPERSARLWPRLRMISCWTDGNCAPAARELAPLFPHAEIHGKGLLATEGFVSLPWKDRGAAALAVRSHFFEFLPLDSEQPRLAHSLEVGRRYSTLLTTGGGLYRYDLGDVIEVVGHVRRCPLIRFVARRRVSDWRGEKLHEEHVSQAVTTALHEQAVAPRFAMLACDTTGDTPAYVLYVDSSASEERLGRAAAAVEEALMENFHYRHARRIGQLGLVRAFAAEDAQASYLSACCARGQRLGDVKPAVLERRDGWTQVFRGRFVEPRQDQRRTA